MGAEIDPLEFLGREPDERLLGADLSALPETAGRPEEPRPAASRGRIVAVGATMTGLTLVGGAVLAAFAIVDSVVSGLGAAQVVMLVLGVLLVATHWGWVHVAELAAQSADVRGNRSVQERNRRWLASIEPYTRWSVSSSALQDGSIAILTLRHRPVVRGDRHFSFAAEVVDRELHSGEEPAAEVAARAEELRRRAAAATADSRARYEAVRAADDQARLEAADEVQRIAAVRAASEALSERINAHLRDPPLIE